MSHSSQARKVFHRTFSKNCLRLMVKGQILPSMMYRDAIESFNFSLTEGLVRVSDADVIQDIAPLNQIKY